MTKVIGTDISFYQDNDATPEGVNFDKMKKKANFVIIRAGQNTWIDSDFKENWQAAKKAGMPRGSYWYYDSRSEPKKQAEKWKTALGDDWGELPLCADLEENYGGAYKGWEKWYVFLEHLKKIMPNKEVLIYTNYYYWKDNAPNKNTQAGSLAYFHQYSFWVARYQATEPLVPPPWKKDEWTFWQYTDRGKGKDYGVESGSVDLNYFNGTLDDFNARFNLDAVPATSKSYKVDLSLRENPDINALLIGTLAHDEVIEHLEQNTNGDWLRIKRANLQEGWISTQYLIEENTPLPPSPPSPPTPPPATDDKWAQVTSSTGLNIRKSDNSSSKIIGKLKEKQITKVLAFNADQSWAKILADNGDDDLIGWGDAKYFHFTKDKPEPPKPNQITGKVLPPSGLNIREGAGTHFAILGFLKQNQIVDILEFNDKKTWVAIQEKDENGLKGWCAANYFNFSENPSEPSPTSDWYQVNTYSLNVRKSGSLNATVLGTVKKGEIIKKLDEDNKKKWFKIQSSQNLIGWVYAQNLSKINVPTEKG